MMTEIVPKLSSDKVKVRQEGIKVINTWLEGEESILFPEYLSEKPALEIPHSEAMPFLVALLTPCVTSELLSSQRRLPSLNFAKTLRLVFQCAKDPNISVLPALTQGILFDLADEEINPRVRENLLFNVCEHPHWSSERRLLNLSMIEKLLLKLRDPGYQVGVTLARQIGVLSQTWEGHNELLQDICFNFGAKLENFSRGKVVTAKEVIAYGPQPRLFLETAIGLMQLALEREKIELEAGFIMSAVAAMVPCRREIVGAALDNLPRILQYTSVRSKSRDLVIANMEPINFMQYCFHWLLTVLLNEDTSNLNWASKLSRLVKTPIRVCSFGRPRPVIMKAKMVSHTSIYAIKCRDHIVLGADSRMTDSESAKVLREKYQKIICLDEGPEGSPEGSIFLLVTGDSDFVDEVADKVINRLKKVSEKRRMVEIAAEYVSRAIEEGGLDDEEYVGYIVAGASYVDDLAIGEAAAQFEVYHVLKPEKEKDCQVVPVGRFIGEGSGRKYLKRFANFREDITEKAAIRLVFNALRCSSRHDPATGGHLRTLSISRHKRANNEMNSLIHIVDEKPCDASVPYMTVQGGFRVEL